MAGIARKGFTYSLVWLDSHSFGYCSDIILPAPRAVTCTEAGIGLEKCTGISIQIVRSSSFETIAMLLRGIPCLSALGSGVSVDPHTDQWVFVRSVIEMMA